MTGGLPEPPGHAARGCGYPMMTDRHRLCYVIPEIDLGTSTHYAHTRRSLEALARHVQLHVIAQHAVGQPEVAGAHCVTTLTARVRGLRILQLLRRLLSARRHGYRHVHVHYSYSAAIAAALMSRVTRSQVSYWHCGQPKQFYRSFRWSWAGIVKALTDEVPFRIALFLVHRLVTGTPSMADYYIREFGVRRDKIVVVPNDIDLGRFSASKEKAVAKSHLGFAADRPVVLFVHHVSPRKGAHYLVPIAELVRLVVPGVLFVVVGSGPFLPALAGEVETRGLSETFRLVGAVPNRSITTYYAAADVFLMPSDEEGFPRVLLEAQAMGVPVVAADVGGVRDIVTSRQAEFVVPRGMVHGFADGVTRLLKDPALRSALAAEGIVNVARFDVHQVVPNLVSALFQERAMTTRIGEAGRRRLVGTNRRNPS